MAAENYGFTRDPNMIGTMAIQPWYNKRTGEVFSAPDGAYEPPSADWVSGDKPADFIPTDPVTGAPGAPGGQDPIAQLYRDVLGRDPDPEGLAYWRQQFGDTVDPNEFAQFQRGAQPELAQRAGGPETEAIDPSQSTLSPNFSNYVYNMLAKGEQAANLPFQEYTGQRFAGPSDLQQQAFARYLGLSEPSQFGEATGIARLAAQQAQGLGYTPGQFTADQISPQALQQYQMTAPRDVTAQRARAAQLGAAPQATAQQFDVPERAGFERVGAERVSAPDLRDLRMEAAAPVSAERVGAQDITAAQTDYRPDLQTFQMGPAERISGLPTATSRDIQAARSTFDPNIQRFQMGDVERIGGLPTATSRDIEAAQTSFRPDLQAFQMQAPEERVTAESFAQPGTAQALMSPYIQSVIDKQTREAIRQADIARGGRGARYAQAGAFGGSRQAIEEAEAERNLQTQLGDITATGLQAAYDRAQQQFNQEQQARQAAQQANIGTGLTVGQQNLASQLGVQQLGAQTGLQTALANLSNQQQSAVQNEANRLQAQGMNQQQALQTALANQGVSLTSAQQNLAAALGTQQLGVQTNLQVAMQNLSNEQQANVQSEANRLQAQGMNQQQALQTALANQQAGMRVGEQNLAAQLGVQQLGTQTGLQTALANLSNQQQAAVQNEANRLQAQGMNQQQALQAALANQGVQQQAGLQNLSAALQTQGLGAQTGMEAQRLNQSAGLQALLANQQAGMQTGQFNAQQAYNAALQNAQMRQQTELANQQMLGQYGLQQGQFQQAANMQNPQMALQAALANQQMGYNVGAQNLAANLGVQQLGAQQDLTAQQLNQQYGLDAQRLAEQSRQFGAGYGLQGIGQQISAGQLMSGIGAQAGQYGLGSLQGMLAAGGTQQQLAQQPYDFGYQQWQQSQQYPYQQATYMQSLLGGLPLQAAPYNPGGSALGNIGAGIATGLGVYNMMNQNPAGTVTMGAGNVYQPTTGTKPGGQ